MNKFNLIILIQTILLIIFIYIDYYLFYTLYPYSNSKNDYKILKWCYLEDIIDKLDSGDLLLFSAYEFSKYTRLFGHLEYSHIGMILKTNKLYSIEMIENDYIFPGHSTYSNINKFDLIERIIHYPGFVYIASYNNKLTDLQYNKLKYICNINFKYPTQFQNFNLLFKNNNILCNLSNMKCQNKNKSIHCSNLIAQILFNLNIYNFNNIKPINYHKSIIELCNGDLFTEPIRIISKKNIINNIYNNQITYYC